MRNRRRRRRMARAAKLLLILFHFISIIIIIIFLMFRHCGSTTAKCEYIFYSRVFAVVRLFFGVLVSHIFAGNARWK